jgi:hypothetical protein
MHYIPKFILAKNEPLHVSGSSSAHHQEFTNCTLGTGMCHTVVIIKGFVTMRGHMNVKKGNEPFFLNPLKGREFFEYPSYCLFIRNHSGPWV